MRALKESSATETLKGTTYCPLKALLHSSLPSVLLIALLCEALPDPWMKSTHQNPVWAGIWSQQSLWMLCICRKDFSSLIIPNQPHIAVSLPTIFCKATHSLDVRVNASKHVSVVLPWVFDRHFIVARLGAGILSPWVPWLHIWLSSGLCSSSSPFREANFLPPSSFSMALREHALPRDVSARSGPFSWKSGTGAQHYPPEGRRDLDFSLPFLGDYVWSNEPWLWYLRSSGSFPISSSPALWPHLLFLRSCQSLHTHLGALKISGIKMPNRWFWREGGAKVCAHTCQSMACWHQGHLLIPGGRGALSSWSRRATGDVQGRSHFPGDTLGSHLPIPSAIFPDGLPSILQVFPSF